MRALLLSLAVAAAAPTASAAPNMMTSMLLHDPDPHGARCLDGTPPRIWVHNSTSTNPANRSKWAWHFQGGGWCESQESCTNRAFDPKSCMLGSSREECFNANGCNVRPFAPVMDFLDLPAVNGARWGGGLLNNSEGTNPLAHDWNHVLMMYCDGGSYSGNNASATLVPTENGTRPIYYRGARNLDFALQTLSRTHSMGAATDILISGDSAGGLASYWHGDRFQETFPKAFVATVPDSGFFIADPTYPAWPASLRWIATAMNSTSGLDKSCVAAAAKSGKTAAEACTAPEDVAPHIQVPLFAMNSKYDPAMLGISAGHPKTPALINALAGRFEQKVRTAVLGRANNGAWITGCHQHCGQWTQGQRAGSNSDFNTTIGGTTAPFAVRDWYLENRNAFFERAGAAAAGPPAHAHAHFTSAVYPCTNCCAGGNGP